MTELKPAPGPVYSPVKTLMLSLTDACNLRCDYCFVVKTPRRMSSETARQTVDWFLHRDISGTEYDVTINLFGGEPFLEIDLAEKIVAWAREPRPNTYKRVHFSATTNGTVATPRVERLVRDARMKLLVSLDGGPAASGHRPFASGRPSYERVAANLPRLASWAPAVMVRATFHPAALDLVDNVRHLLALGAPAIALCPVLEADWGAHQDALEAAYEALGDWYVAEARSGTAPPLEVTAMLLRQWHAARSGSPRPSRPCAVGAGLLGVDPDGHVMPCHRFLYRPQDWLGTVDSTELSARRWPYVHLASRDILGCAACPAEPVCGGGCRVVALAGGRGLHDTHPGYCTTMRAHARMVYRIYDILTAERSPALARLLAAPLQLDPLADLITY